MKCVSQSEFDLDPTISNVLSGQRQGRLSHVNSQNCQTERGKVKSNLAGPAACIGHRPGESALGGQTHDRRLRLANIPGSRTVLVGRTPGPARHPFVAGCLPCRGLDTLCPLACSFPL